MTRQATTGMSTTIGRQQNIGQQSVLFHYGTWIGLPANNKWGFDIVSLSGDYHESLLAKQDFQALMLCFSAALKQYGILKGGVGQNANIGGRTSRSTNAIARTRVARNSGTTTGGTGTGGTGGTGSITRRATRSRVSGTRTQTPAVNSSTPVGTS